MLDTNSGFLVRWDKIKLIRYRNKKGTVVIPLFGARLFQRLEGSERVLTPLRTEPFLAKLIPHK